MSNDSPAAAAEAREEACAHQVLNYQFDRLTGKCERLVCISCGEVFDRLTLPEDQTYKQRRCSHSSVRYDLANGRASCWNCDLTWDLPRATDDELRKPTAEVCKRDASAAETAEGRKETCMHVLSKYWFDPATGKFQGATCMVCGKVVDAKAEQTR